ncbi:hypothetical protein BX070DRAFT_119685 [Coemansia spiralis]|nr:hypothetical protein BX070DRAFT_119685 [Coemansia spiralis]
MMALAFKPSQAGLALGSVIGAVYCLYRLFSHVSTFMLDNHGQVCSDSEWNWSNYSSCFRSGFLWPALFLLAAGLSAAVLATCLILPFSLSAADSAGFASNGSAPLACLSVGNMETPIRRPPGPVVAVDNRLRVGTLITMLLAVQAALFSAWCCSTSTSDNSTLLYSAALAQSTALCFVFATACLVFYTHSNRLFYVRLFPWILPVLTGVQLALGLIEMYLSFFTAENSNVPIFSHSASVRSNYLVSITVLNFVIAILFLSAQQRTIFTRPLDNTSIADLDSSYTQLANEAEYADDSESTPLGHSNEKRTADLVDSPEFNSSWFNRITFSWINDLLHMGAARKLGYSDLYNLSMVDMPVPNWKRHLNYRKPGRSLFITISLAFAPELLLQAALFIVICILEFTGPFFLQRIIRSIELSSKSSVEISIRHLYLDAFGLLFFTLFASLTIAQDFWLDRQIAVRLKGILVAELISKTLHRQRKGSLEKKKNTSKTADNEEVTPKASSAAADGKIMNLLTADFHSVSFS